MNHRTFYIWVLVLFVGFSIKLKAQDFSDDAAIWAHVSLQKKLNNNWDIRFKQQNRINENVSYYGQGYADIGISYKINSNWKLIGDYVFGQKRLLDNSYSTRHQFYAAVIYKKSIGRWELLWRNMIQAKMKDVYSSEDGKVPEFIERNKLTLKFELNKYIQFYASEELNLPFYQAENKGLSRSRSTIGLDYNISKNTQIETYFLFHRELNSFSYTERFFVYGIGISHNL
jgi:hypothetical protein